MGNPLIKMAATAATEPISREGAGRQADELTIAAVNWLEESWAEDATKDLKPLTEGQADEVYRALSRAAQRIEGVGVDRQIIDLGNGKFCVRYKARERRKMERAAKD